MDPNTLSRISFKVYSIGWVATCIAGLLGGDYSTFYVTPVIATAWPFLVLGYLLGGK